MTVGVYQFKLQFFRILLNLWAINNIPPDAHYFFMLVKNMAFCQRNHQGISL